MKEWSWRFALWKINLNSEKYLTGALLVLLAGLAVFPDKKYQIEIENER